MHIFISYLRKSSLTICLSLLLILSSLSAFSQEYFSTEFVQEITGNYELNCDFEGDMARNNQAEVCMSGTSDLSEGVFINLSAEGYSVVRRSKDSSQDTLINKSGKTALPWKFRLLKQGSYFRFWINDYEEWIQGPSGQLSNQFEPWTSHIGVKVKTGLSIREASVTQLPMLSQLEGVKVISHDPKGTSWKDLQMIPGTILKWTDGKYYMYFMGASYGPAESGAAYRSIGLAVSSDLKTWEVKPEKIIQAFDNNQEYYPGGAVIMPNGEVGLMFATQDKNLQWKGFYLATSDTPDGKFKIENNEKPVFKFKNAAHEFDLVKLENHQYKYLMIFAGFSPSNRGDRGFMAYSNDLMHWTEDEVPPSFLPETRDNWDAKHIRPRSLTKIDDTWYLWYEGVNKRGNYYSDVVGLARSKDLYHWEYHPRNPILSGMGISASQPDNTWTGWPRMVIKDDLAYIFYAGANPIRKPVNTCMKTMTIDELTNWESTGTKIDLVKNEVSSDEDLFCHLKKYAPPSKEFLEMKKQMNKGWNTWNTNSVLSHVLLPECLGINLELKDLKSTKTLRNALIGRKDENSEKIIPLAHSYDGAYTDLIIKWKGISARVQSATTKNDNVIMITPHESENKGGHIIIHPMMLWDQRGEITLENKTFNATLSGQSIPIFTQSSNEIIELSATLEISMSDTIVISTGKDWSVSDVAGIIYKAKQTLEEQKSKYKDVADIYEPLQNVLAWDVIYEPSIDQVIAPVSRVWNVTGWNGWVLFDWDTYFASYMFALDNKELAYSNALAITNHVTPAGFIPNFTSGLGRSDDRSQPPVGSMVIKEIYRAHQEKWFLEETFDKLLDWNRWWDKSRSVDGYLCWGSDPYEFPGSFPLWLQTNVNRIQGSKWESGLDNSPMYDNISHDTVSHTMRLADVGLISLYIMDCKALEEIALELGKNKLAKEIKKRELKYTKALQTLWDDELGIFLNKDLEKDQLSKRLSPTLFYPMLAGVASQTQAERMIKEHFYNPEEFWGDYIIPTIARNDEAYEDQDYWRGRIWAPLNFLVYLGLRQYDIGNAQTDMVEKSNDLILKSWKEQRAVYENYNGITGRGDDVFNSDKFYHWGALLSFITFIEEGYIKAPEQSILDK